MGFYWCCCLATSHRFRYVFAGEGAVLERELKEALLFSSPTPPPSYSLVLRFWSCLRLFFFICRCFHVCSLSSALGSSCTSALVSRVSYLFLFSSLSLGVAFFCSFSSLVVVGLFVYRFGRFAGPSLRFGRLFTRLGPS